MVNDKIKELYKTHSVSYINAIKDRLKVKYQDLIINQLLQRTIVILYNTT